MSVDVQPNGFRFVTCGSDNLVKVWNLLPAVSVRYEKGPAVYPGPVPLKTQVEPPEDSKMGGDSDVRCF